MPWENISHKGLYDLSFADCFCPFRVYFPMVGISARVQKVAVGWAIGRGLLPTCLVFIKCSMCFGQVWPQMAYFAKSKIQTVPPRKIESSFYLNLFFSPSWSGLGGGRAVILLGKAMKTFPLLHWLEIFFHELISVCQGCSEDRVFLLWMLPSRWPSLLLQEMVPT